MKNKKIYFLGTMLGLNKKEIDYTLKDRIDINNKLFFSASDCYKSGTMYGVISTKDL
jgi:hypothetical protein